MVEKIERPNINEYFLRIAMLVATRSTCVRRHVGAIAVKDKRILATGYNGAVAGAVDCLRLGCLRDEQNIKSGSNHEICRAVHAEQNVIIQAATSGVNLEDSVIYCTHTPCIICAKMLVNCRIRSFISCNDYGEKGFIEVFQDAGIKHMKFTMPSPEISVLI